MIVEIFLRNSDFSSPDGFVMVSCSKTNSDLTSPDGLVAQSPVLSSLHWKEFFLENVKYKRNCAKESSIIKIISHLS